MFVSLYDSAYGLSMFIQGLFIIFWALSLTLNCDIPDVWAVKENFNKALNF